MVAVAGCNDHGKSPCSGTRTEAPFVFDDPQIQFLVDRCHSDATTCNDLCTAILEHDMIAGMLHDCTVTCDAQGLPSVRITYACRTTTGFDGGMPPPFPDATVLIDAP